MTKKKTTKKKPRITRPDLLGKAPAEKATPDKAAPAKKAKSEKAPKKPRTKTGPAAGTLIERTYKGQKVVVQATADGYLYKGKPYASLTAVALAITGYAAVSGPRFFGLDGKAGK